MTALRGTVAAVAIAAVAGCLLLMVEAGERMYATLGPTRMAVTADGSLHVVSHGRLHTFASDGTRRASLDLAALGVSRRPSEFVLHADGRAVFADPDTSLLARCVLPAGPCERLDPGLSAAEAQSIRPLNSVRVAIDEAAQRYYISDNAGHRVVIADFSGRALRTSPPRTFRYPNQLAVTAPGELTVSDTNHHRIATFDVRGDRVGPRLREIHTADTGIARPGRSWVFDAQAMPGGETWALVADGRMRNADVLVFDAAGRAMRRVDLGGDSDPFAIRLWNGAVLVADATHYRIANAAVAGAPAALRDAQFVRELESERQRVEDWRTWRLAAQVGLVAIPAIAILALWKLGVPLGAPAAGGAGAPARSTGGVVWIGMDPQYVARTRRQMRLAGWAIAIIHVVVAAALAVMAAAGEVAALAGALLPLAASPIFFFIVLRSAYRSIERARLGTSDAHLHLDSAGPFGAAHARQVKWRDVYFDGGRLLAGPDLILVFHPQGGWRFPQADFMREIAARVPSRNRVSVRALAWQSVLAGSPLGILIVIGTLTAIAWLGWQLATLL